MTRSYGIAITLFIFTIPPTMTSAQTLNGRWHAESPKSFTPLSVARNDIPVNVNALEEYGLRPEQALPKIKVKLTAMRDSTPANPQDVIRRAGRAIATARTGPGGGVTFSDVSPGAYVIVFQVVEWTAPQIRSNARRIVEYTSGYEWRVFPDAGYQYAIRAPNLIFVADELSRSRDDMANQVVTIAQQFEITGSAPVAVHIAIGLIISDR
jgi:hypothetical protein